MPARAINVVRQYELDLQSCAEALLLILPWRPDKDPRQETEGTSSEGERRAVEIRPHPEGVTPQG
jgi:hypothetical protein